MGREPSKKIFLPSSRQARPPSPVHLRRRGMPACPAYPVIRNNAAPFLFRTIPIPSVHDAGWHVRVYEASSTVKKKVPRRLREHAHELWRTAASGYEQWQLINYINLYNNPTSVRPLQRHLIFSPSPRQRNLLEVEKTGIIKKGNPPCPAKLHPPIPSDTEKARAHESLRPCNAWTICMIDHPLRIYPLLYKLQCRH